MLYALGLLWVHSICSYICYKIYNTLISWNAMISGYGNLEMASGFFQTALVRGVRGSVIITRYMKGNKVKLAEVFKDKSGNLECISYV